MIVFIAMVLVASFAGAMLISVANNVREQAASTGDQATNGVASGFIKQGVVAQFDTDIKMDFVDIEMKHDNSGPKIDMTKTFVTATIGGNPSTLEYSYSNTMIDATSQFAAYLTYENSLDFAVDSIAEQGDAISILIGGEFFTDSGWNLDIDNATEFQIQIQFGVESPFTINLTTPVVHPGANTTRLLSNNYANTEPDFNLQEIQGFFAWGGNLTRLSIDLIITSHCPGFNINNLVVNILGRGLLFANSHPSDWGAMYYGDLYYEQPVYDFHTDHLVERGDIVMIRIGGHGSDISWDLNLGASQELRFQVAPDSMDPTILDVTTPAQLAIGYMPLSFTNTYPGGASQFYGTRMWGGFDSPTSLVESINITLKLAAGSPSINMRNVVVSMLYGANDFTFTFGPDGNSSGYTLFGSSLLFQVDNSGYGPAYTVKQGDFLSIQIGNHESMLAIQNVQRLHIEIMPAFGQSTILEFTTPEIYSGQVMRID